jgi:hypothetical protein
MAVLQVIGADPDLARRQASTRRTQECRDRQKRRALQVKIEVEPPVVAALERLALLDVGEREPAALIQAVQRYLAGAAAIARLGDALWP